MSHTFKVAMTTKFPTYLGVPSILGRASMDQLQPLLERFHRNDQGGFLGAVNQDILCGNALLVEFTAMKLAMTVAC
ncbi:hypothetical protein FRX31_021588 [Thalictrum thalictroides]|uniref:Uncharacterized protein n=1 Tax=Thalictrum thalictroides TaxID=46969 RepID=A0A7J6VXA2_THATH|nr:hypothetical protein FRX31_021588 [Thalictrum thalictroides]